MTGFMRVWDMGDAFARAVDREAERCEQSIAELWAKMIFDDGEQE